MPETDENQVSTSVPDESGDSDGLEDQFLEVSEELERCLILVGRVRGVLLGLKVEESGGVDRITHVTPLPDSRPYITGLVYFHGGIESAVDVGIILGGEALELTSRTRAVLAETPGMKGVILFDELLDMHEIKVEDITPVEVFDIPEGPIAGKFIYNGEAGFLLSPEGLFNYIVGDR